MRYRPEIDGLRAVAVIPVILFHAGFSLFSGGFVGVDVFFVISGYLITTIILDELEQGKFSIINFYERRARRILPALFFVMFACLPFAWFWLLPQDMRGFAESLVAVSLFASNILFWRESGYFDTAAELKPLLHTWSLAVEEQYYVLFPLFLMLAWRFGKRWILVTLSFIFLLSLCVAQWGSIVKPAASFFLLPARGWELLIGAFVAFYFSSDDQWQPSRTLREVGGVLGLIFLVTAIFTFDKQTPFPSLWTLLPTVGTALIIFCSGQQTAVGRLLGSKLFVGIGLISYSAYLWHQPLFAFARHRSLENPNEVINVVLILASIIFAFLTWRFVEKPFRKNGCYSRARIFAFTCVGGCWFAVIGVVGSLGNFDFLRYEKTAYEKHLKVQSMILPKTHCGQDFFETKPVPCVLGSKDAIYTLIAVGDSHIAQWADALNIIGLEKNIKIIMYSKAACANSSIAYYYDKINRVYDECSVWRSGVIAEIEKSDAKAILLTTSSAGYVKFDGGFPSGQDWSNGVKDFVEKVSVNKPRIFWLIDNPRYWDFNPLTCFERGVLVNADFTECGSDKRRAVNPDIVAAELTVLRELPRVKIVDFTDFYCKHDVCNAVINDAPIMRDGNHLTKAATMMLKNRLADVLSNFR